MFSMKLNFNKEFILKVLIIAIILTFVFSTLSIWVNNRDNNKNNIPNDDYDDEDYIIQMGQGKIALVVKEYSGSIELNRIVNESIDFVNEGVASGDVLFFNIEPNKVSIVLSDKDKTYEYAKYLVEKDSEVQILLKVRVYSPEKYDFITDSGEIVQASVPESEIKVSYPYKIGEMLYYNALVQIYNGNVVGAQLNPMAKVEELDMIFLVNERYNDYYSRMFFNWRDRETIRALTFDINSSLGDVGATNVEMNYVSDITIYASRAFYSDESDLLKEHFDDIKTINMNKIVFYDNSTVTENEVSEVVFNITNGSVTLDFSPALFEIIFNYEGDYEDVNSVFEELNDFSIVKYHYVTANLHTGNTQVISGDSVYDTGEINYTGFIPTNKNVNDIVTLRVDATIQANQIIEIEQIFEFEFE